jgi:hypothetical protein
MFVPMRFVLVPRLAALYAVAAGCLLGPALSTLSPSDALAQSKGAKPAARSSVPQPTPAPADDDKATKDRARDLAKRGIQASQQGRHEEAVELLTEAESLFHAPTHLLYLARSQAALGKLLEAKTTYEKLAGEQIPEGAPAAFRDARERGSAELTELDGRIPRIVVRVEPADAPGLVLTLSGKTIDPAQLGQPIAIDPGTYVVEAQATGLQGAKRELVAEPSKTLDVTLALATGSSSVGAGDTSGESGVSTRTILSIGAIGLGVAGLGVGTALGVVSLGKRSDADALEIEARDPSCDSACRSQLVQQTEALDGDANLFGNLGIVGLGLGGALVATGVVLLLTDGEPEATASSAWVRPVLSPGFVGVEGAF